MQKPVIYIIGVSGCGKTTIGKLLSGKINIPFFDADDLHSAANKQKMHAGHALTDEDRQQWLTAVNLLASEQSKLKGAIIACSALKEKYRKILAENIENPIWILLQGNYKLIYERMQKRKDHYMPAELLQSQFEALEIPDYAFIIDIKNDTAKIVELIIEWLQKL